MKVVQLINRAYVYSGVVSRSLDAVDGDEGADGLFLLNQLLTEKSMTGDLVPYYGERIIPTQNNVSTYFVEGLIELASIAFNINTTRWPMMGARRKEFFASARVDNVKSLPYQYFWDRVNGGVNIKLYFIPDKNYPLTVTGKFYLDEVGNDDELNETVDKYYQLYLMYCLADYICIWNKITTNPRISQKIKEFEDNLFDMNATDYTTQKISTLSENSYFNYAQANLGKGWVP